MAYRVMIKKMDMERVRYVGTGSEERLLSGGIGAGCQPVRKFRPLGRLLLGLVVCFFSGLDVMARLPESVPADTLSGQDGRGDRISEDREKGLFLVGDYAEGRVSLRWAAGSCSQWRHILEKGIFLERYEFRTEKSDSASGDSLSDRKIVLSDRKEIFLPPFLQKDTADLSAWAEKDTYAALLGEAVYAPRLHLNAGQAPVPDWAVLRSREEEENLRFILANLAYDRSFPVACLGGMGYADTLLHPDCYYLYRVFLRDVFDTVLLGADTAVFLTRQDEFRRQALLPPVTLRVDFGKNTARIRWKAVGTDVPAVGYFVERAARGEAFRRLDREPYMDFVQKSGRSVSYTDSLPRTGKEYRYRLLARDLFGKEWVVAQSGYGKAHVSLESSPVWDSAGLSEKALQLHWSFPEDEQGCLRGFSLYALPFPTAALPEAPVLSSFSPKTRSCRLDRKKLPFPSAYLYLVAEGKEAERRVSGPLFWQDSDSLPPPVPSGLEARTDSSGVLSLKWRAVEGEDCAGYRVFLGLSSEGEPVQLTAGLLSDTVFSDTLSLHTDRTFFYAVCSEDIRGNRSALSSWLEVDNGLPRKPHPPVFSFRCISDGKKVVLYWENSPSPFLQGQELQYSVDGSGWMPLKDFPKGKYSLLPDSYVFAFPPSSRDRHYVFRLMAYGKERERDTAFSPFCYSVRQRVRPELSRPSLSVDRDRGFVHVQWRNPDRGDVKRVCLYREKDSDGFLLLGSLSGLRAKEAYYADFSVEMNTAYRYCLQVEFSDGSWSEMSEAASVEY